MTFATVSDIEDYLNVELTSESYPKESVVEGWLESTSAEIRNIIKQEVEVTTKTDVILDITSENTSASQTNWDAIRFTKIPPYRDLIMIPDENIVSLDKVEINTRGPNEPPEWTELSVGIGNSVRLYRNYVQLLTPDIRPLTGNYKMRISYTYGDPTLLPVAKDLTIYMTALKFVDQRLISESGQGTGGPVRIGDIQIDSNRTFDLDLRMKIQTQLEDRLKQLGTFNVYII